MKKHQQQIDYNRVAEAIDHILRNFRSQPSLDDLADQAELSTSHFQRLFTDWAGVSPKKFLQYTSITHAKKMLKLNRESLSGAAYETGLSGSGRLHDLFVTIEAMTPGDYKNGGENLLIRYTFRQTPFGQILAASTTRGICYLEFSCNHTDGLNRLKQRFPNAELHPDTDPNHLQACSFFERDWNRPSQVKLHLKGTPFQLKVWRALLTIPEGRLLSYGDLSDRIEHPRAARAVGRAVGSNPVAFLIPCHRVIRATGLIGEYRWGKVRKNALIGWEAAKTDPFRKDP